MIKDISNQRFGRLTAIKPTGEKRWRSSLWECLCECGNTHIVATNTLKSGLVRSCGCLLKDTARKTSTRHGDFGSQTYKSWDAMIQRCTNPKNKSFKNYGARGISVCEQWRKYEQFRDDMGERPANTSLDRIDVNGNYTPENCRWASLKTQARNQRRPRLSFDQAEQIRQMSSQGDGPKVIAETLKITRNQVGSVIYLGNVTSRD